MTLRLSFQRSQPGCHPGQRTICSSIVSRSRPFPGRGAARRQRIRFAEPVRGEGATPDTPLRHGSTSGQLPGRLGPPLRRRGRRSPRCEVATPGTRSSRRSTRATCQLLSAPSTQQLGRASSAVAFRRWTASSREGVIVRDAAARPHRGRCAASHRSSSIRHVLPEHTEDRLLWLRGCTLLVQRTCTVLLLLSSQ